MADADALDTMILTGGRGVGGGARFGGYNRDWRFSSVSLEEDIK
jgi:hypothetical protein